MKYRVKKEHPGLQEGEMRANGSTYDFVSKHGFILCLCYSERVIKEWLKEGWVEEIQEPEFTEKEVISILVKYDCDFVEDSQNCDFVELIKEWKYNKNKRNEK